MSTYAIRELAAAFWEAAGEVEPFPRGLRRPLVRGALDVTVKEVPRLGVRSVERYLTGQAVAWSCRGPDRCLRACLTACNGAGWIFLDAGDPAGERTFSLAHELGHFLRDYWWPRRRAVALFGEAVLEVFDGRRPRRPGERLHALIRDVPLGFHTHLMERGPPLGSGSRAIAAAEREADALAYELLAPAEEVLARLRGVAAPARALRAVDLLGTGFGLPLAPAEAYAGLLLPTPPEDPLLRRLRT
jgi:hypothetical protein